MKGKMKGKMAKWHPIFFHHYQDLHGIITGISYMESSSLGFNSALYYKIIITYSIFDHHFWDSYGTLDRIIIIRIQFRIGNDHQHQDSILYHSNWIQSNLKTKTSMSGANWRSIDSKVFKMPKQMYHVQIGRVSI